MRLMNLVHVHEWLTASAGIELKHDWKVPLLATIHATERGRHHSHLPNETSHQINQLEWQVCYEAWRIIVCSSYMAGELGRFFGVPLDKVILIPNGVDITPFQGCPAERVRDLRAQYAPKRGKNCSSSSAASPRRRGCRCCCNALPSLRRRYPNVRLLVAGKNSEQMQPLVDELGIGEAVELLGFIDSETRNCLYRASRRSDLSQPL